MRWRATLGESLLCLAFVGIGVFWIASAARLALWDGFAPATGFMPLVYGVLLVGLASAALLFESQSADQPASTRDPVQRPLLVVGTLAAGIAGIESAGFAVSIFLATAFLLLVIERVRILGGFLVALGTAASLTLIFRSWLGVPLPAGPWGF